MLRLFYVYFVQSNSMVHFWRRTSVNYITPSLLLRTLTFTFPFYFCLILPWSRSLFNNYFLIWSNIRESSVATKTIFNHFLFFRKTKSPLKSIIALICWRITSWIRLDKISRGIQFLLFSVSLYPKFMIGSI